ncbi:hypothetical protein GGE61_004844 [Rhizobium leguminosarum]|uniref:hypothetical protein n=1 Tax=Rhizobium leguminosarum TaxID=384 RepID=UPI001616E978|nr:hypothetical protein [Rhizobium leguminosarum]MBB4388499.1 hypothetical protein [Rhizobium leguminosarum]
MVISAAIRPSFGHFRDIDLQVSPKIATIVLHDAIMMQLSLPAFNENCRSAI